MLQGLAGGVKELQMGNVETLTIDSNTAALTLSGAKTTGLQTVKLDAAGTAVTLADFQNSALNMQFVDTNTNAADVIVADVANLNLIVGDDDDTVDSMAGNITAADATSIALNIADKASFSGALVADQATSLTLDSASSLALNFDAATDLSSIENMVLKSNGAVSFPSLAHLGGNSDSIAVDAAAVKGAFSAEFNAYAKGGASLEVVGSHLAGNAITVNGGYDDIDVTGGIQVDTIALKNVDDADIRLNTGLGTDAVSITAAAKAEDISVSGNLGNNGESVIVNGSAATGGIKIDLSGLEGYAKSTITGVDGKADTLIGGSGDDEIIAGNITNIATGDILTGGAGNDTFVLSKATAGTTPGISATITDFGNGDDLIQGFGAGSGVFAALSNSADTLADLWSAIVSDTTDVQDGTKIVAGMVGEDTYIFSVNVTTPGSDVKTDAIVKLAGVDATDISADMFVA